MSLKSKFQGNILSSSYPPFQIQISSCIIPATQNFLSIKAALQFIKFVMLSIYNKIDILGCSIGREFQIFFRIFHKVYHSHSAFKKTSFLIEKNDMKLVFLVIIILVNGLNSFSEKSG